MPSRHIPPEAKRRGIPPVTTRANRDLARKNPSTTQDPRTLWPTQPSASRDRAAAAYRAHPGRHSTLRRSSSAYSAVAVRLRPSGPHDAPQSGTFLQPSPSPPRSPRGDLNHRRSRARLTTAGSEKDHLRMPSGALCRTRAARALYVRHTPDRSPWVHPPPEQHTTQTEALSPDPDVHTTRRHTHKPQHTPTPPCPHAKHHQWKRRVGLSYSVRQSAPRDGEEGGERRPQNPTPPQPQGRELCRWSRAHCALSAWPHRCIRSTTTNAACTARTPRDIAV